MDQLTKTNTALSAHPAAELFPVLSDKELAALAEDIRQNGQTMPVVVWDDRNLVVDGRNRLAACQALGIEPRIERRAFADDATVARFVVSANVQRRHLTESQRAMIAARLKADFFGPTAAHRKVGGGRAGRAKQLGHPPNLAEAQISRDSRDEAAHAVSVSHGLVDAATRVVSRGAPEVQAAVDAGDLAVTAAASIVDRDPDQQRSILERVKNGEVRSVRAALAALDEPKNERDFQGQHGAAETRPSKASTHSRKSTPIGDRRHPFFGLITSADNSTCTWGSLVEGLFYSTPRFANSTIAQRMELIIAIKSEIRAANRFITWLEKQAGRTKSS